MPKAEAFYEESFLPFARPCISDAAISEVADCLRSGWITTGPRVQKFEQALRDYFSTPHAITVSSATAGLHLALLSLDLQPGDEVIMPAFTFVATANTIVQAGGKPVFIDINPETYNLDLDQMEQAMTKRTKAVVPVHFAGQPVNLDRLYAWASAQGIRVIEDAAHAIGTEYKNRKLGSFGDIQVFSFHPNKNMTTGEGGVIITRDDEIAKRLQRLRFHGIDRVAWNRFSKSGSQHYDVVEPGFKYNMMDIQAALGLHQLPALGGFIDKRTKIAQSYLKDLKDWDSLTLPRIDPTSTRHAWHLMNPLITGMDRDAFMAEMKQLNIGTGFHYRPVHLFKYYQESFGYKRGDFPHSERVGETIVSLPLFPDMTEKDYDRVIFAMKEILGG